MCYYTFYDLMGCVRWPADKNPPLLFLNPIEPENKTNVRPFCCDDRCQWILVVPSTLLAEPSRNAERTLRSVRDGPWGGGRHFPRRIRPQSRTSEGMLIFYQCNFFFFVVFFFLFLLLLVFRIALSLQVATFGSSSSGRSTFSSTPSTWK